MSIFGELTRKILDHPKEYVELHKLAIEAMVESQDLLERMNVIREERDRLRDRVKELERKADREREFIRAEGVMFRIAPDGQSLEQVPYCLVCWENDQAILRMNYGSESSFFCPKCHAERRPVFHKGAAITRESAKAQTRLAQRLAQHD